MPCPLCVRRPSALRGHPRPDLTDAPSQHDEEGADDDYEQDTDPEPGEEPAESASHAASSSGAGAGPVLDGAAGEYDDDAYTGTGAGAGSR